MPRWNETPEFKALQKEFYRRIEDEGFQDIEGGVEGHLLQQRSPTRSLGAAASEMHGRLARYKATVGAGERGDPKRHEKWLDDRVLDYYEKGKTNYYAAAQWLGTNIFLTKALRDLKLSWSMHSDGYGEEVIADELQIPRSRVRKYLYAMKEKIKFYLDLNLEP